ncbi:MAG TPA: hypothetical protein VF422_09095 [Dokdonella sp.]
MNRHPSLSTPLLATALLFASAGGVRAATFTVGGAADAACSHHSLAAAIAAAAANGPGMDTIRVAQNMTHANLALAIVDQSLTVVGGYINCADGSASGRTVLSGSPTLPQPTLRASGTAQVNFLVLENLDIVGAQTATLGGGLRLLGNQFVTLRNTRLRDGRAERGGGVYVDAYDEGAIDLFLDEDSRIENNVATHAGGGIHCRGSAAVTLDAAFLTGNLAEHHGEVSVESGSGGGAALYDGCRLRQATGVANGNVAEQDGGAYYLRNGAELVLVGDAGASALLYDNLAENGGAIAVEDDAGQPASEVDIRDARINGNAAGFQGGAIALLRGGELSMRRVLRGAACHTTLQCSDLSFNDAASGRAGAIFVGQDASATISGTWIEGNIGYVGSVLWLQGNGIAVFDSDMIVDNSGAVALFQASNLLAGHLAIGWSTITGNLFDNELADQLVSATGSGTIDLYGLVLGQHLLHATNDPAGIVVRSDCVARDPFMLPLGTGANFTRQVELAAPYGLDAFGRIADGHALPADFCDTSLAPRLHGDIDGDAAASDAAAANVYGIHDLGADEYQVEDLIFADGFEAEG